MIDHGDHAFAGNDGTERAALADFGLNVEPTVVAQQDVLGDGQAKTRSTGLARAALVDPIKALGQPRQVFGRDADASVLDLEAPFAVGLDPAHVDLASFRRVADGI